MPVLRLGGSALELRATIFVTMFIVPLVCLLVLASVLTAYIIATNSITTYERVFSYYMNEMDDNLNAISVYLANTASKSLDLTDLIYDKNRPQSQLNIRNLYLYLKQDISYYPNVQYMFMYVDGAITMISSPYANNTGKLSYSKVKPFLSSYIASGKWAHSQWELKQIQDEQYLVRTLEYNGVYIGACVNTDTLIKQLKKYAVISNFKGFPNSIAIDTAAVNFSTDESQDAILWVPLLRFTLRTPSVEGSFSSVFTIDLSIELLYLVIVLFLSCMLLFMIPLSKQYLRRQFLKPIKILTSHMTRIKEGDINIILPEQLGGPEMSFVAQTFNQMMAEINDLNQRISDERLAERNLEMQCLNMQLDPHFFLNTLNSILLLSRNGKQAELQKIIHNFSNYFRSIFQAGESCLKLSEELGRCRDYANIYRIRCYKDFTVEFNIPEELYDCMVPQMCVQTFVENSLKYAMEDINGLHVCVDACSIQNQDGPMLKITIRDNGSGFSDAALEKLELQTTDYWSRAEHIGILNLIQRLQFLYGEKGTLKFGNFPTGGAYITICIPMPDSSAGNLKNQEGNL
jgi:two-component system sensor histidine kinase YesM